MGLKVFEVFITRDTLQEITVKVEAADESEAIEKALDKAKTSEWSDSDYLGDPQVETVKEAENE